VGAVGREFGRDGPPPLIEVGAKIEAGIPVFLCGLTFSGHRAAFPRTVFSRLSQARFSHLVHGSSALALVLRICRVFITSAASGWSPGKTAAERFFISLCRRVGTSDVRNACNGAKIHIFAGPG